MAGLCVCLCVLIMLYNFCNAYVDDDVDNDMDSRMLTPRMARTSKHNASMLCISTLLLHAT